MFEYYVYACEMTELENSLSILLLFDTYIIYWKVLCLDRKLMTFSTKIAR